MAACRRGRVTKGSGGQRGADWVVILSLAHRTVWLKRQAKEEG